MSYEIVMNVGFAISDEKRGCSIIGGIDDKFSIDRLDITWKNIIVKNSLNELVFQVRKVDISTSIAGKINIGLVLSNSVDFNKIKPGDEVLKVLK